MKKIVNPDIKEKSKLTKEEWREYTRTVWTIANTSRDDHPAVFPAEIPLRLAKMFSFYGETVLDPFAGTGTTARAVIPLGRRAVCVDQNARYVRTIKKEGRKIHNGQGPEATLRWRCPKPKKRRFTNRLRLVTSPTQRLP